MDVDAIREDFPILKKRVHGKKLVYLDNAATTQKPKQVIEAIKEFYSDYNANVQRGVYEISEKATELYEGGRESVAKFINATSSKEIIFVRNATEAINLVANAWAKKNIGKDDEIIISIMEHHSNFVPWQQLAIENNAKIKVVGVDPEGHFKFDEYESLLSDKTKLVAITHVSNVLGTITPVKEIVKKAHEKGAMTLVDGAQSVPHIPVDVQQIGCDFLAFSGHKMLAPTGIGILYGKKEILEKMDPFLKGGDMIKEVHLDSTRWNELPWKFEAGTPNIEGGITMKVAIDYLNRIGMPNIREHEKKLTKYALDAFANTKGIDVYGPRNVEEKGGVVSFNVQQIHPHDLASILDEEGIAIRSGHHCAQPLMENLGLVAASRASFYLYNKEEEIDILINSLKKARKVFRLE
ncbi:cysteine desulfurase [Candidatus Micrarchaeota archaeon]|nr:cysteine desulfurase [Candidatus Micrarchaeota archaeon]